MLRALSVMSCQQLKLCPRLLYKKNKDKNKKQEQNQKKNDKDINEMTI
jgi:hypothetical protein